MSFLTTFFLMAPPDGDGGGAMINLIFLGAIFFVFYFFIIRPQSKRQKEVQKKVSELKKGDKVVTGGGLIGIVNTIDEDTVLLEIDSGVKARFQKGSITDVNPGKS
ncbi:MAG: preprotein translocase subunit YajC [Balneolaceae bacterium]|nr:MAG: preprotein translocase subunit YajC [Balneolaceae bacterium]